MRATDADLLLTIELASDGAQNTRAVVDVWPYSLVLVETGACRR